MRKKQAEKSPFSRSDAYVNEMMGKYAGWLAEQDLPEPIVRANNALMVVSSPFVKLGAGLLKKRGSMEKLSPSMLGRTRPSIGSMPSPSIPQPTAGQPIVTSHHQHTLHRPPWGDDVFVMDEMYSAHSSSADLGFLPSSPAAMTIPVPVPAWKASGSPRSVLSLFDIFF